MSKAIEPAQVWHKTFVSDVREITGCSHEAAFAVLGLVIDMRESSQQQGYARGFDTAQKEVIDRLNNGVELPKISPGLIDALRSQKQVDEDGTDCGVNRQAVDEAITALTQLQSYGAAQRLAGAKEEREACGKTNLFTG